MDQDLDAFAIETRRVATIFRFRASPLELTQITQAYFKAFRSRPLPSVIAGADNWIAKGARFPKPAEWLAEMPRPGTISVDVPVMGMTEADEWLRAERLRWQDEACDCFACQAAGVTHQPIRFVPETTEDDRDRRVHHPLTHRVVTSGHWAHGQELARWYQARAEFWKLFTVSLPKHLVPQTTGSTQKVTVTQRIEAAFSRPKPVLVVSREPGDENDADL